MPVMVKAKSNKSVLLTFLKGSITAFCAAIVANVICTLCTTVVPLVISFTVDSVLGDEPASGGFKVIADALGGVETFKSNLWIPAAAVAVFALLNAFFSYANNCLNGYANQTLVKNMRDGLFSHVQRLPLERATMTSTGDVIQRCTSDVWNLSNFISNQMVSLFRIFITMAVSIVFMFILNAGLAGISMALSAVITVVSVAVRAVMHKRFKVWCGRSGGSGTRGTSSNGKTPIIRGFG